MELARKTGLSGGGDGGRESNGLACNRDERIGGPLEQRAGGAGVAAGGVLAARVVSGRISSPTKARVTPERSLDQRIDALSRANEVRALRAQLKRELKAGRVSIGPVQTREVIARQAEAPWRFRDSPSRTRSSPYPGCAFS
jgi:hypothetical protein